MVEPAHITFDKNGRGAFAFGALEATMELEYAQRTFFFTWIGFDVRRIHGDAFGVAVAHNDGGTARLLSAAIGEQMPYFALALSLQGVVHLTGRDR
jgi:hypothetical protein